MHFPQETRILHDFERLQNNVQSSCNVCDRDHRRKSDDDPRDVSDDDRGHVCDDDLHDVYVLRDVCDVRHDDVPRDDHDDVCDHGHAYVLPYVRVHAYVPRDDGVCVPDDGNDGDSHDGRDDDPPCARACVHGHVCGDGPRDDRVCGLRDDRGDALPCVRACGRVRAYDDDPDGDDVCDPRDAYACDRGRACDDDPRDDHGDDPRDDRVYARGRACGDGPPYVRACDPPYARDRDDDGDSPFPCEYDGDDAR